VKPKYEDLKANYHSSDPASSSYMAGADVYALVGLDMTKLMAQNPGYINTCATRMSIALLGAGVNFVGRVLVKSGPYKDKRIEPGAKLLADQLMRKEVFGRDRYRDPALRLPLLLRLQGSLVLGVELGLSNTICAAVLSQSFVR
jgi:hypothetical protein